MSLAIVQYTTGYVNPAFSIRDTGWTISGQYAIHTSCNSGIINSITNIGLTIGRQYTITYIVDNYASGGVQISLGTHVGTNRTAAGTYTETLTCLGNTAMSFFSDGSLRIQRLKFYDTLLGQKSGTVISFNEGENKWGTEYSFNKAEQIIKFVDGLFSISNGNLYEHNVNPIRNNFYGVQYPSRLTFISNKEYFKDKLWFNMRLDAKGKWSAPSLTTVPTNQFPNGMLSYIKRDNFKLIDGKLWASILKDVSDPNYATQTAVTALFNGRMMQGGWLIVEMENNDTTDAQLSSIEVYVCDVERSL